MNANIETKPIEIEIVIENDNKMNANIETKPIENDNGKNTVKPELFIVYFNNNKSRFYFTNETYAKKILFDMIIRYYSASHDDDDEEQQLPYLEAFGKGKWANLQSLYELEVDIDNILNLSSKEKCNIIDSAAIMKKNDKFEQK